MLIVPSFHLFMPKGPNLCNNSSTFFSNCLFSFKILNTLRNTWMSLLVEFTFEVEWMVVVANWMKIFNVLVIGPNFWLGTSEDCLFDEGFEQENHAWWCSCSDVQLVRAKVYWFIWFFLVWMWWIKSFLWYCCR